MSYSGKIKSQSFEYIRNSKVAPKITTSGFTLVELLVVIAIIALLLSILLPSLRKVKSMAMRLKCAHNLKQINLAVNFYLNENDNIYPCAQDPLPAGYWLWMGRGWRFLVEPYLGGNIDANNPSVLFCPQDYAALARHLLDIGVKPHIVLEQAVEAGSPKTMITVEALRKNVQYARRVFAKFA